jgi:AraC family L-rhamnose operon regulatory protein RhaS
MKDTLDSRRSRSAIFLSRTTTYHADRCEPLRDAVARGEVKLASFCRRGYPGISLPTKVLPEISTVGYWDATGPQTWGLDWHRNEGIELTYLARGKTEFLAGKKQYLLESGNLVITRPWQEHRVGNPHVGACRLHWLILDAGIRRPDQPWHWPKWLILSPEDVRSLTTLLSHNVQPLWLASGDIARCFDKIAAQVDMSDPVKAQSRLQLYINELFVALLELLQEKKVVLNAHLATTKRSVELFLAELPRHLDHPWTLAEMAEQCGLGRTRFADYCRQIANLTPAEYLAACRVQGARQMLKEQPQSSITDIAMSCGFQTSQYFATVFRQKTGLTPREFRERGAEGPTA